ncbi:PAS domain-containing sensor histidine kinase [Natrarchaeobaculum sulfurireducens]|uniref:histidine kinase n=1 Tax=Natrarchaeobaculum sulfurireducens TaxID=2044521 RepID=A0A346PG79_9EURY|nr:HAMP domain-containing sensor histidine kinase [Natrarchaeobaculum sulfurireducens]AXR78524.1 Signal transduction histidine kinase, contains PAS domain [Natrarchaeobaculum sulfurireducens]
MHPRHELTKYVGSEDCAEESVSEFFGQLVEDIGVGVAAVGTNGTFIYVNDHYAGMLGRTKEDLIGRSVGEINTAFDQARFEEYWHSFSMNETHVAETVHRTASGETVPVRTNVTRVEIGGEPVNVGTIQDISELERRREQLDVLRRVLRHDLRNRLNVVSGYVDLIELELDSTDELHDHFTHIQTEIEHLLATSENSRRLENLLDESASGPSQRTKMVRLDRLLEEALARVRTKFPGVDVETVDPGPVRVRAAEYLGQAITHVLSNGILHNDSERPRIELGVTVGEERVVLSVADNGPGIPDERKDLVFGREETDQLHHGNGFGLFFVENVVEESDGEIWIEDNEPRGSIFKIALDLEPRAPVDRAERV